MYNHIFGKTYLPVYLKMGNYWREILKSISEKKLQSCTNYYAVLIVDRREG